MLRQLGCRNNRSVFFNNPVLNRLLNPSKPFYPPTLLPCMPPVAAYREEIGITEPKPSARCHPSHCLTHSAYPTHYLSPHPLSHNTYPKRKAKQNNTHIATTNVVYFSHIANVYSFYSWLTALPSFPVVLPPQPTGTDMDLGTRPLPPPLLQSRHYPRDKTCEKQIIKSEEVINIDNNNSQIMYIMCALIRATVVINPYYSLSLSSLTLPLTKNHPRNTNNLTLSRAPNNKLMSPPLFTKIAPMYVNVSNSVDIISWCNLGQVKFALRFRVQQCLMLKTSKVGHCQMDCPLRNLNNHDPK